MRAKELFIITLRHPGIMLRIFQACLYPTQIKALRAHSSAGAGVEAAAVHLEEARWQYYR